MFELNDTLDGLIIPEENIINIVDDKGKKNDYKGNKYSKNNK